MGVNTVEKPHLIPSKTMIPDFNSGCKATNYPIYLNFGSELHKIKISDATTPEELHCAIAALTRMPLESSSGYTFKITRGGRAVVGLKANTESEPYDIEIVYNLSTTTEELQNLRAQFSKIDMDKVTLDGSCYVLRDNPIKYEPAFIVSDDTSKSLKSPAFNNWKYQDNELIHLIMHIYESIQVMDEFNIKKEVLYNFLCQVRANYNQNPFHNFKHAFCVFQMAYSILAASGALFKLNALQRLSLLTACLGHGKSILMRP